MNTWNYVIQQKAYTYENINNVVKELIKKTENVIKEIRNMGNSNKSFITNKFTIDMYKNLMYGYITFVLLYDKRMMISYNKWKNIRNESEILQLLNISSEGNDKSSENSNIKKQLANQTIRIFFNFLKSRPTNNTTDYIKRVNISSVLHKVIGMKPPMSGLIDKLKPALLLMKEVNDPEPAQFVKVMTDLVNELKTSQIMSNMDGLINELNKLLTEPDLV